MPRSSPAERRRRPALRDRLLRTLASDRSSEDAWVVHVRIGVVLSVLTAALVLVHLGLHPGRPNRGASVALALAAGLASPLLLLVPVRRWVRDRRGAVFFYCWSAAVTAVIAAFAVLDRSPEVMVLLLALTLTYAAVAYPPSGVLLVGLLMTAAHAGVLLAVGPGWTTFPVLSTGSLLLFSAMAAWSSRNQWAMRRRQAALQRELEHLAASDPLTGCLNRRAFQGRLSRSGRAALVLLDLDGFKAVNDTRGHAAGDAVLVAVAAALAGQLRPGDELARLGGDEFAVLLPGADLDGDGGRALAERFTAAVRTAADGSGVTASAGVAALAGPDDAGTALARADAAMYRAKTHRAGQRRSPSPPAGD